MSLSNVRIDDTGAPLEAWPCPYCRTNLNAATAQFEDARPRPGDLSLCFACGGMLKFSELMIPLRLEQNEFMSLPADIKRSLEESQDFVRGNNPE